MVQSNGDIYNLLRRQGCQYLELHVVATEDLDDNILKHKQQIIIFQGPVWAEDAKVWEP
jgi:hypothetical protein